jgi:hypothetical protein
MEVQYGGERMLAAVTLITLYSDPTHALLRPEIRNRSAGPCVQSDCSALCSFRGGLRSRKGQGWGWVGHTKNEATALTLLRLLSLLRMRPQVRPTDSALVKCGVDKWLRRPDNRREGSDCQD